MTIVPDTMIPPGARRRARVCGRFKLIVMGAIRLHVDITASGWIDVVAWVRGCCRPS